MIELLILVAAVCLLAPAMRHFIRWLVIRELDAELAHLDRLAEIERKRRYMADVRMGFYAGLNRRNSHAIITGITS